MGRSFAGAPLSLPVGAVYAGLVPKFEFFFNMKFLLDSLKSFRGTSTASLFVTASSIMQL